MCSFSAILISTGWAYETGSALLGVPLLWHESPFSRLVLGLEIVAHLLHCDPFYAFVLVDVLDEPAFLRQ